MRRSVNILMVGIALCACGYPQDAHAQSRKSRELKMLSPPAAYRAPATTRPATIQGTPVSPNLRQLYERTETRFRSAVFYKPRDRTGTAEERKFAVVIAQETPSTRDIPNHLRIGAIEKDEEGRWTVDTSRPTVYTAESFVILGNTYCAQRIHIWAYPAPDGKGAIWRGVRTTYGPTNYPLVWELLTADGQPTVMFVSKTFEKAAEREYGRPLSGRRASAERGLDEHPNLVVARVLPDGAEPMGPVVYVDATAYVPTTVLCRCMSPQTAQYVEKPEYEILPLDNLGDVQVAADGPFRLIRSSTPPESSADRPWIEQALRCPQRF